MKKLITTIALAAVMAVPTAATTAYAGPSADALAACLVKSASPEDHVVLVDWIFAMVARHPSLASMATISDAQRADINRKAGALFTRLMTDDCGAEVKQAYKEEGEGAIQGAFQVLGSTAMQDLMTNPAVQAAGNEIDPYFDEKKLNAILGQ